MRKVLSFVLVLSLVLGSFSMAFAADSKSGLSDVAGIANEEAITVNVNLGIIDGYPDGTFGPEKSVTRAEFAKMITKAMGIPESALAGYTKVSFKDTTGHGWAVPYLAFCESKGILNGYGDGTVRPGNTVTVNEAMTMVLRAIGYTANSADLVGVWPANYVTLAQKNGLYDKVAATVTADRASAAQIIYNVLTVQTVSVATDGKTTASGNCLLVDGLNCDFDTFVVTGDEETLINLKSYVGKECKVFFKKDKPNAIVAIAKEESSAVKGEFNNDVTITAIGAPTDSAIISGSATRLIDGDDVEYTFSTVVPNLFVNGESWALNVDKAITSDTSVTVNGDIRGKKINSISSLTVWELDASGLASKGDLDQIADDMLLGGEFATLKNGDIDTNSFELVGVKSLSDIKVDNVVYVYWKTGNTITKVEVGTDVVEGKVTAVNTKSGKYTVDGKAYEFAAAATETRPVAGDEVKLYLDVNGDIYKCEVTSGKTDKYAVVMTDGTTTGKEEVKLYTSDDEAVWFNYTSKASAGNFQPGKIIGYALDNNGKVKATTLGGANVTSGDVNVAGLLNADVKSPSVVSIGGVSFKVDSKAVVFTATVGAVVTPNGITTMDNVDLGVISASAILNDKGDTIVALMVKDGQASRTTDDIYGVINTVEGTVNDDGDADQTVDGIAGAVTINKRTTDDDTVTLSWLDGSVKLFKFEYNGDGLIKTVTPVADGDNGGKVEVTQTTAKAINGVVAIQDAATNVWLPVAKDVVVYRAIINKDGEVDKYVVSNMSAINKEYAVMVVETDNDDNKVATAGADYVIFMTKADFDKYGGAW